MIEIFAAGFLGGIIRALVGMTKYLTAKPGKKRRMHTDWMILSLTSSGGMCLMAYVFKMRKRNWD